MARKRFHEQVGWIWDADERWITTRQVISRPWADNRENLVGDGCQLDRKQWRRQNGEFGGGQASRGIVQFCESLVVLGPTAGRRAVSHQALSACHSAAAQPDLIKYTGLSSGCRTLSGGRVDCRWTLVRCNRAHWPGTARTSGLCVWACACLCVSSVCPACMAVLPPPHESDVT